MNDAMCGQDEEGGAVHVDEGHHDELVGCEARLSAAEESAASVFSAFVAIVECGFVTVVAIGDDEFFVAHGGADRIDQARIGDLPHAMNDSIFVGDRDIGLCGSGEQGFDLAGVLVKHKNLAKVGAGGAEQVEAIGFRLGEGLFVAEDDTGGIILNAAEGDEAAAFQFLCWNREE